MQTNFFKIMKLLEMYKGKYTTPYRVRKEIKIEREIKEDYSRYINEAASRPDLLPFVHDYPVSIFSVPLEEIERMTDRINSQEQINEKERRNTTDKAPPYQEKCCTCGGVKVTHNPNNPNNPNNPSEFKTAKDMLSAAALAELPQRKTISSSTAQKEEIDPEANIDTRFIQMVYNEVLHPEERIEWEQIAGLKAAKEAIKEIIVWPMVRPDLFHGLRGPPRALLLFGPPGTGKTLIGKCIASQASATFFSISASSLTSKWVGEGEKMVRALFYAAGKKAPSVIFIDEIDSLLMQRTEGENEGTRRLKTELLIQMDGAKQSKAHILVIGATNRPQEIDEAARRRFVKKLYIPLPDAQARAEMISLIGKKELEIDEKGILRLAEMLEGYSGSDIFNLCREAAMEAVREVSSLSAVENLRKITVEDFIKATKQIRKSVSEKDLEIYTQWSKDFGSMGV